MSKERELTEKEIKKYNLRNKRKISGGTKSDYKGLEFTFLEPDEKATKKAKEIEKDAVGLIGYKEPVKRNTGGSATNKKTYQVISPSEFHGAGPHITDSSVLLAKTSGSMTKKEARKAGLTGAGKRSATNKVIKRKSGGSARGTQGQTSGKNFSGIY